MTTAQLTQDQFETSLIESTFIKMVKVEMILSGKSFDEAKEIVKQELRKQGLM